MHQSIATIDSPEFINLQPLDINPLMSSCEIKVLYLGENRNHSYISKEVASEMAKTLRGAPIVGYYKDDKEDFADHGERIIFEGGEVKVDCMTVPYGFVAPDAKVWFKKFDDKDDFGNTITREYLMTTGYLWTGQFEEAKLAVEGEGRPHSMELDGNSLDGNWSTNLKTGMDFFIINDAIFSKLCILGEDVEPCFEGSSVTSPKVSTSFTAVTDDFKMTLFNMMQDLRFALEGGKEMSKEIQEFENSQDNIDEIVIDETENSTEENTTFTSEEEAVNETVVEESDVEPVAEFSEDKEEEKAEANDSEVIEDVAEYKLSDKEEEEDKEDENKAEEEDDSKKEEEDEENKKKYALLESQYADLEAKYNSLLEENESLKSFKLKIENEQKDSIINKFYMLNDSDKKEIIENKDKYSLEEIESKLSVIFARKSFELENQKASEEPEKDQKDVVTTFGLVNEFDNAPDWVKAVRLTEENM